MTKQGENKQNESIEVSMGGNKGSCVSGGSSGGSNGGSNDVSNGDGGINIM